MMDVNDAQWLQQLHQYGLLRGSFRPAQDLAALRGNLRQRERLLEYAASHIQHMHKALMQMNIQLHHIVSDITGVTGMKINREIVAGARDLVELAKYRDVRCKASLETIRESLIGNYRPEHIFSLTQALELYHFYQMQGAVCDQRIEAVLTKLREGIAPPATPLPSPRQRKHQVNAPQFDVRAALHALLGIDLTQIHVIGLYVALKLVGECGTDGLRWPTVKHFTSWLCLAPGNKISGGKVLASRTRRSRSGAAAPLRLAAMTVGKMDTAVGAFYRRLGAGVGKSKAVTATARKIAVLFYNTLRYGLVYVDPGASYYEERYRQCAVANLRRRAKTLGFLVQDLPDAALGVS